MKFEVVAGGDPEKECGQEAPRKPPPVMIRRGEPKRGRPWLQVKLRGDSFRRTLRRHGRDCCLIEANGQIHLAMRDQDPPLDVSGF